MNTLRRNLQKAGYSQEDGYFYQKDRELIEKLKRKGSHLTLIRGGGEASSSAKSEYSPPESSSFRKAA